MIEFDPTIPRSPEFLCYTIMPYVAGESLRVRLEYVQPSIRAMLAAAIGASDQAIALAHQACDERDAFMSFAAVCMPMSAALRRHSRFGEILDRMHLR
jgi:hypothetical protein